MNRIVNRAAAFTLLLAIAFLITTQRVYAEDTAKPIRKKVIEFGWDEPDTEYVKNHVREMEQQPFDGFVMHVRYNQPDGSRYPGKGGSFLWDAWGSRTLKESELTAALSDLKTTKFERFTDVFVRLDVTPGNVDWFDDFSPIVSNIRQLARLAKAGGLKGIFFDIEQYGFPLFDFKRQRYAGQRSFEQYAAQTALRGKEIITAMQSEYPGVKVIFTYGYSLPWEISEGDVAKSKRSNYSLFGPFLDGMLEGARGDTKFVDGFEFSYRFKERAAFRRAALEVKSDLLPIVALKSVYLHRFSLAFGLWLDAPVGKTPWNRENLELNFFSPSQFAKSVEFALEETDEYVWIYNQASHWFVRSRPDEEVPESYRIELHKILEKHKKL